MRNAKLRPGSDAVLHMSRIEFEFRPTQINLSRIEFSELSSCEVRRLNQFETADIIGIGLAVLRRLAQPGITVVDRLDSDADLHMSRTKYIN